MNLHALERTTTLSAVAFAVAGGALAEATKYERLSPHEMFAVLAGFVVVLGGALTLAFVRWLNRVEKNVPRNPDRAAAGIANLVRAIEKLDSTVGRLDAKVDGIDVRLGRVEGNLGSLIVVSGDRQ